MRRIGFLAALFLTWHLEACTGLKVTAQDGTCIHGRTLEFGVEIKSYVAVIPKGFNFVATTPSGPGMSYKAQYTACGIYCFNTIALMDGLNEKGLSVGTFYFPGFASYSEIDNSNQSRALSPVDFPNWLLTQFATLDEIKGALSGVHIAPTVIKEWGPTPPPFHYIVYDKAGNSLVIEPFGGKLVWYDNPLGVLTNSPGFEWHMTHLRNYIDLQAENASPKSIGPVTLAPLGQGSGMVGLPGDFTPPSRFVRAALFSANALPVSGAIEAVLQTFHLLNAFDIPKGIARVTQGNVIHADYTMATCVRDPVNFRYYFKTYDDQSIKMIDLKKFKPDENKIRKIETGGSQPLTDISRSLK